MGSDAPSGKLRAGFTQQAWDLFLAPIPQSMLYKAPVGGALYVKHQYCVEVLNRAFGEDGWSMEVKECWAHDQYTDRYGLKDGQGQPVSDETGQLVFREKLGRYFAEALVRLAICAPGYPHPAVREDIGSHVAAADWSESRKAAVSEALKRAAARFGFAAEVYKTEEIERQYGEDWETAILPTYRAPYELPIAHLVALKEWMAQLGWPEDRQHEEIARCIDADTTGNLGRNLKWVLNTARPDALELMREMDTPEVERETVLAQIVDVKSGQAVVTRLRAERDDMTWAGAAAAGDGEQKRLIPEEGDGGTH